MLRDLHAFIAALRGRKEILEITAPVDPRLELAEIHRRVIEEQGPALLFRNVKGSSVPVVTNLFGTKSRVELAFGNEGKKLVAEVAKLPEELLVRVHQVPFLVLYQLHRLIEEHAGFDGKQRGRYH